MSADAADSVARDDRLRLFVGLPLPDPFADSLAAWQALELAESPTIRTVPRAQLHVTIAFLGSRPAGDLDAIAEAVRAAAARHRDALVLAPLRYRETRSVAMLVLSDEQRRASRLAGSIQRRLEEAGVYRRERRDWLPHVTVARFGERPRLERPAPSLAPFSPSEVAVYHSVLRPTGAQYEILESVALGG